MLPNVCATPSCASVASDASSRRASPLSIPIRSSAAPMPRAAAPMPRAASVGHATSPACKGTPSPRGASPHSLVSAYAIAREKQLDLRKEQLDEHQLGLRTARAAHEATLREVRETLDTRERALREYDAKLRAQGGRLEAGLTALREREGDLASREAAMQRKLELLSSAILGGQPGKGPGATPAGPWKAVPGANGSTYYWNTSTNEVSWEEPPGAPRNACARTAPTAPAAAEPHAASAGSGPGDGGGVRSTSQEHATCAPTPSPQQLRELVAASQQHRRDAAELEAADRYGRPKSREIVTCGPADARLPERVGGAGAHRLRCHYCEWFFDAHRLVPHLRACVRCAVWFTG